MVARARQALTQKAVNAARATGKAYVLGDNACPGLRLWVGKTGTKRWQRQEGTRTVILGDACTIPLTQARALATGPIQASAVEARTIGALAERYLAANTHLAKNTWRRQTLKKYFEDVLDQPLDTLTKEWVIGRQRSLLALGYMGSTARKLQSVGRAFANWLVDREHLDRTPFRRLPPIPVDDMTFYATDDAGIIKLELVCKEWPDPRVAAAVMIALTTGMRKGEILALTWDDFDFTQRRLTVRASIAKTMGGRLLKMPRKLVAFLEERREQLPGKRPFADGSLNRHWSKLREKAKLASHLTFHGCRHSYASALLRRGADLKEIQEALGHTTPRHTLRYLHNLRVETGRTADLIDQGPNTTLMKLPD